MILPALFRDIHTLAVKKEFKDVVCFTRFWDHGEDNLRISGRPPGDFERAEEVTATEMVHVPTGHEIQSVGFLGRFTQQVAVVILCESACLCQRLRISPCQQVVHGDRVPDGAVERKRRDCQFQLGIDPLRVFAIDLIDVGQRQVIIRVRRFQPDCALQIQLGLTEGNVRLRCSGRKRNPRHLEGSGPATEAGVLFGNRNRVGGTERVQGLRPLCGTNRGKIVRQVCRKKRLEVDVVGCWIIQNGGDPAVVVVGQEGGRREVKEQGGEEQYDDS